MALRTWSLPTLPKATIEDPNDETLGWTVQHTAGPTQLHVYSPFKYSRVDAAGITNGSATVTDVSIVAADLGKPVSGPGIPFGSYVGTVTPGVSFLLSSNPTSQVNVNATGSTGAISLGVGTTYLAWKAQGDNLSTQGANGRPDAGTLPSTIAAPGISTSTSGGSLPTGILNSYAYTYTSAMGESVLSAVATVTTGAGATNSNTITPAALPPWATGVNIYGRLTSQASGLVVLQNQATAAAWIDTGALVTATVGGVTVNAAGNVVLHPNSGKNEVLALVNH